LRIFDQKMMFLQKNNYVGLALKVEALIGAAVQAASARCAPLSTESVSNSVWEWQVPEPSR
jgi:hypothetical protein